MPSVMDCLDVKSEAALSLKHSSYNCCHVVVLVVLE